MTDTITNLEALLAELPEEKAQEVFDFAAYLHQQYVTHPQRGSAQALLQALDSSGPLEFDEGELEGLLIELEALRRLDRVEDV